VANFGGRGDLPNSYDIHRPNGARIRITGRSITPCKVLCDRAKYTMYRYRLRLKALLHIRLLYFQNKRNILAIACSVGLFGQLESLASFCSASQTLA
jgi:hypothetical protein